jgi:hypothetical protein
LADCQVKKLLFFNACCEKTYIQPCFALRAGGQRVQGLYRVYVIPFLTSPLQGAVTMNYDITPKELTAKSRARKILIDLSKKDK